MEHLGHSIIFLSVPTGNWLIGRMGIGREVERE